MSITIHIFISISRLFIFLLYFFYFTYITQFINMHLLIAFSYKTPCNALECHFIEASLSLPEIPKIRIPKIKKKKKQNRHIIFWRQP